VDRDGKQQHGGRASSRPAAQKRALEPGLDEQHPTGQRRVRPATPAPRLVVLALRLRSHLRRMLAPPGTLYVVATPLGNLEDVTLRALRVLREVSFVACEDTRRTAVLLRAHGITARTTSYFEHNERWKGERILHALRDGRDVALVSDAGTPAISDPGYRLVRDARAAGIPVVPVPGPSAVIAALSVSGLPTDRFLFAGFLPSRPGARREALRQLAGVRETLVFYESPVRVREAVRDMRETLGDRESFLCREATKLHEEYARGTLSELGVRLDARESVKGEIVLVVSGRPETEAASGEPPEEIYARLVAEVSTRREAVKETARRLGLPAREVYRRVLPRRQ
jgi:16S rRNA (cytidine1402-2'-O)-methyltransferase